MSTRPTNPALAASTYKIVFRDRSRSSRTVTAHHMTNWPANFPGMLIFTDADSELVTMITRDEILSVDREGLPPGPGGEPADLCAAPGGPPPTATVAASPGVTVHVGLAGAGAGLGQVLYTTVQQDALRNGIWRGDW